jgi:uncharacterized protein YprB with RNaseH-like and TPR domain
LSKSREYMSRLEALNRGPLKNEPADKPQAEEIARRIRRKVGREDAVMSASDLPARPKAVLAPKPAPVVEPTLTDPVALADVVEGVEIDVPGAGTAYLVEKRLTGVDDQIIALERMFCAGEPACDTMLGDALKRAVCGPDMLPGELLFMDIETTGLSCASPLFLIGTLQYHEDSLLVRQFLARDYSEEPGVNALFAESLARAGALVTFNGKSFDMPYIVARAAANGVEMATGVPHLDLLPESRRQWRRQLPNCKLQTLEFHVCGRQRTGDIPGSQIPDAYHRFVRTSDASQMAAIIEHNALDLLTMVDLVCHLGRKPREG